MASIKKRLNGKYQATISLGRDENGKRVIKYVTKNTVKECQRAAQEIELEYKAGGR